MSVDKLRFSGGSLRLNVTLGCDFTCEHCCFECSPKRYRERLTKDEIADAIVEAGKAGVKSLEINGGEPAHFIDDLVLPVSYASGAGMSVAFRTNGSWAVNKTLTLKTLRALKAMGVSLLGLSYDNYHAKFISFDNIKRIIDGALSLNLDFWVDWCGLEGGEAINKVAGEYHRYFREVGGSAPVKIGRARSLGEGAFRRVDLTTLEWGGGSALHCGDYRYPDVTLFPGGGIMLDCCHGNARLLKQHNAHIGWLKEWARLVVTDPAVAFLHDYGVGGLIRLAREREINLREHYSMGCELCFEVLPQLFPLNEVRNEQSSYSEMAKSSS